VNAAALAGLTAASYAAGWLLSVPILVPILNAAASYPFMVAAIRRGDLRLGVARMLLWALTMAVCATLLSYYRPAETDRLILRGAAYRTEMHTWVMTGRGAESTPSAFIPEQLEHAAIFSALALATAGLLAMPVGAVLMNYMGHYVGTLAAIGRHPAWLMILGWHPWAVIRIASFVVIGVVLSAPLIVRLANPERARPSTGSGRAHGTVGAGNARPSIGSGRPEDRHQHARPELVEGRALLLWACAGLTADIVMKALLAPAWQRLLVRLI
jgi:hypothetical protein